MTEERKRIYKLRRLIEAYKDAAIAKSWAGGEAPEDAVETRKTYEKARQDLYLFVREL